MTRWLLCLLFGATFSVTAAELTDPPLVTNYTSVAEKLITAATNSEFAYERLAELCDTFGPRFSGTTNLEKAIDWVMEKMKADGLENVHGEKVMVPRWVRGNESLEMVEPRHQKLQMLGVGMSVGTPPEGITGEVAIFASLDDLEKRAADAKGKIALINEEFEEYDKTVKIRTRGAVTAAKAGAIACLIRSVTFYSMQTPHTGTLRYATNDVPKIPEAAISMENADMFIRIAARGQKIVVRLKMEAKQLDDVPSRNVIGELVGSEKPDEVVVLGGHIDSWDVGQGAMDDGGGCVAAWEAVRIMKKLGLKPRRTIRVVFWTNEENGVRGANAYRDQHKSELNKHMLAIESDHGVFKPSGFVFRGSDRAAGLVLQIGEILKKIDAGRITLGANNADNGRLAEQGVPIADLMVDTSKYFYYHHTEADTIDKLNAHDVALCAASMAVMTYIVADMPQTLRE